MKISPFYLIVSILSLLFLATISYQFFVINDYEYPILFTVSALVVVFIMVIAALYTNPNQLDNAEYRNSKEGRELWKKTIADFVDEHKNDE